MKIRTSLKSAKERCRNCKMVRRGMHVYVLCKNKKHKAKA
jgi:ribosomal protein L36